MNRILVIKLCCLGDIVHLSPALRGVRRKFPHAEITLLISRWVEDLVKCIPFVDNYILYDAPYSGSVLYRVRETVGLLFQLRKRSFDLVIIGHRNRMFGLLALLSGARVRVGFTGVPFLTHQTPFDWTLHEVDRYLGLLGCLGVNVESTDTEVRPLPEDVRFIDALLDTYSVARDTALIGIFPGGGDNPGTSMTIKRWYVNQYIQLVEALCRKEGYVVVLVGHQADVELNHAICEAAGYSHRVINLAGQLNIRQFVALAGRCYLFVGGDSGPTHIAAAAGAPTLSLFGPSDPRLVAPRGRLHRYVWKQVNCSPCYTPVTVINKKNFRGKDFVCWTGTHACMTELTVLDVLQVFREMTKEGLTTAHPIREG